MQLFELQRDEDFGHVLSEDREGPFSADLTKAIAESAAGEQVEEGEVEAEETDPADGGPAPAGSGEPGRRRGDTTEESSNTGAEEGDARVDDEATSATESDPAIYEDSDLERAALPKPSTRGKSPACDAVEGVDGDVRVIVDLSSGIDPDSEVSCSSVLASKLASSAHRTKELEAVARKNMPAPSGPNGPPTSMPVAPLARGLVGSRLGALCPRRSYLRR